VGIASACGGSAEKSWRSLNPNAIETKNIPKDKRSGAIPKRKAIKKRRRVFRPNASVPQRPCEMISIDLIIHLRRKFSQQLQDCYICSNVTEHGSKCYVPMELPLDFP